MTGVLPRMPSTRDSDTPNMTTTLHNYICECNDRRCRERVPLRPARYRELARHGAVVSPYCVGGRLVLYRDPHVRVVASSLLGQMG